MAMNSVKKPNMLVIFILISIILFVIAGYYIYQYVTSDNVSGAKTVEFIKYIHDAKDYKKISNGAIPASAQGNEYNINFWMYISDYGPEVGHVKNVMNKGKQDDSMSNPGIYLLPYDNVLRFQVGLETTSLDACRQDSRSTDPKDYIDVCDVENIPLQRWLNINMSLTNNVIEVFINGKLHKSCTLRGFPRQNRDNLHLCDEGGVNGFIANLKYSNRALPVSKIEKVYNSGPTLKKGFFN